VVEARDLKAGYAMIFLAVRLVYQVMLVMMGFLVILGQLVQLVFLVFRVAADTGCLGLQARQVVMGVVDKEAMEGVAVQVNKASFGGVHPVPAMEVVAEAVAVKVALGEPVVKVAALLMLFTYSTMALAE